MASFQEVKAVFMGLDPAMPEAAKDSRATGGVTLASWQYQNTIIWAVSRGIPRSINPGPARITRTM